MFLFFHSSPFGYRPRIRGRPGLVAIADLSLDPFNYCLGVIFWWPTHRGHSRHVPGSPKTTVDKGQQDLSEKGHIINNSGIGRTVSVTAD